MNTLGSNDSRQSCQVPWRMVGWGIQFKLRGLPRDDHAWQQCTQEKEESIKKMRDAGKNAKEREKFPMHLTLCSQAKDGMKEKLSMALATHLLMCQSD